MGIITIMMRRERGERRKEAIILVKGRGGESLRV